MIRQIRNNIPNGITSLNLLSGCLACIFAFRAQSPCVSLEGYQWAFIAIGAAAIFDFCDGAVARLLNAYSPLGKELDSLADLISFGLAPSLLVFNMMNSFNGGSLLSYISLLIALFGALRLANFNVDSRQSTSFIGLPIPANAIFWIGICAWIYGHHYLGDGIMIALIIVMSALMVSHIGMFSLKFKNLHLKENLKRYLIIIAAIIFILLFGLLGLSLTILFYVIISVFPLKRQS